MQPFLQTHSKSVSLKFSQFKANFRRIFRRLVRQLYIELVTCLLAVSASSKKGNWERLGRKTDHLHGREILVFLAQTLMERHIGGITGIGDWPKSGYWIPYLSVEGTVAEYGWAPSNGTKVKFVLLGFRRKQMVFTESNALIESKELYFDTKIHLSRIIPLIFIVHAPPYFALKICRW